MSAAAAADFSERASVEHERSDCAREAAASPPSEGDSSSALGFANDVGEAPLSMLCSKAPSFSQVFLRDFATALVTTATFDGRTQMLLDR